MKLYSFYTPSHKVLFENFLLPTAKQEYEVVSKFFDSQICKSAEFQSSGWRETQYNKVLFWMSAIQDNMGDLIVCSDVDVQFLGSSKSLIQNISGRNDLVFQKNNVSGDICSGFFVCRCSYKTYNFFEIVAKRLKAIMHLDGGGEQYVIHELLKEGWHGLRIGRLDRSKFWCPGKHYEDLKSLNISTDMIVHHANWTKGIDNKIEQLQYLKSFVLQSESPYEPIQNTESTTIIKGKPRIAVCLSSLLRDFDVFSISFVSRLLKSLPSKPDLIGHFPKSSKTKYNAKILKSFDKYINSSCIVFEDDPDLGSKILSMKENMAFQRSDIKGNLLQWYSLKKCADLLKSLHSENNYDWVIWSRPDLYYFNNLDNILNLDHKYYYTSAHDNHLGGINDRFCIGNFQNVYNRMNIYDYFTKEWYPKYHNNKRYLKFNPATEEYCWNPEIVLKCLLKNKLKLKIKKLDFCFGKIRNKFYVTTPFWYEIYSTERTINTCKDDIINHSVLNFINNLKQYKQYEHSPWPFVNILDDTIMFHHPDRIKEKFHNIPPDSDPDNIPNLGIISKLLCKLRSATMKSNES